MSFVNIGSDAGALNAYQRRLVHQLVRNEFPTLRTFPRNDGYFMQVEHLDVKKEEEVSRHSCLTLGFSNPTLVPEEKGYSIQQSHRKAKGYVNLQVNRVPTYLFRFEMDL